MIKNFKLFLHIVSFFCNSWVLAKHTLHSFALVNCVIEVELNLILAIVHKEESNCFWNPVSDVSNNKIEVMVYPHSEFSHKNTF